MWDLQFLCSPQLNIRFPTSLRPIRSLLYQTTLCCHLLSVHSINMTHCADCHLVWRRDNGKWRTAVVGQNCVNWSYIFACVGTVNGVFIYRTQKGKWLCDLMKKAGRIFRLRQSFNLKTYPPLHLTPPATHRPTAVLLLLIWQQPTVWQLKGGGF